MVHPSGIEYLQLHVHWFVCIHVMYFLDFKIAAIEGTPKPIINCFANLCLLVRQL